MKKKGKLKIILSIITVILAGIGLCIYFFVPISFGMKDVPMPEPLPADTLLTAEQVKEDRDLAIAYMENVHPYFILEKDRTAYEAAKHNYMQAASSEMLVRDFQAATAEYICFFKDGHTRLRWSEEEYVDLRSTYHNGKTYVVENGEITDVYIEEFGGVEITTIYEVIDKMFPAENEMAEAINRYNYVDGKNFLNFIGAEITNDQIKVVFSDGTEGVYSFYNPSEISGTEDEYQGNSWYMDGEIFVVDFNVCVDDEELKTIAAELSSRIDQGCNKVIIDVRENGGGNSQACTRLLESMGMEAPEYDMVIRYSKEAKEQRGYLRSSGMYRWSAKSDGKANNDVNLVVLSDRYTFSSATMMCVYVRDGKLGTIIGESSSNMPSAYGDILYFSLPNSHLYGTVSHKQFIRPDEENKERMLVPDIQTSSEDAYNEAVEYLMKEKQ